LQLSISFATPLDSLKNQPIFSSIGLNKFDLFKQYLGTASGGDGGVAHRRVTQGMAKKAIADARDLGVSFFRISATGYAPSAYGKSGDLDLWRRDPSAYWALFDQMMNDLHAHNMRAVLVLVWHSAQFPAMTRETVPKMLQDPNSKSYVLLSQYATELASRYRLHPALMFYELTNELNLGADLDLIARCPGKRGLSELCDAVGNYSTDDVITFTNRLAGLIREIDPAHLISSGFSVPRAFAENLRENPEWKTKTLAKPDTLEQLRRYLSDIHQAADIISVHLYETKGLSRFGSSDPVDLLMILKQEADRIGKPLFVGEFGNPDASSDVEGSFSDRMLRKIVELRVPYSAMWVWQFYQRNPYTIHDNKNNKFSLEPGYTDQLIEKIKVANKALGNFVPEPKGDDNNAPRVVLTWPIECAKLKSKQKIYAVASDDRGQVGRVEFWLNGSKLVSDDSPPYEIDLHTSNLAKGEHEIAAIAFDIAGNRSEWKTKVLVGKPVSADSHCGRATGGF
jgi:hypothetical protein